MTAWILLPIWPKPKRERQPSDSKIDGLIKEKVATLAHEVFLGREMLLFLRSESLV